MSAEKLSSDEVPHKFAEWLLGMGCPAEKVPSIEKMSQMCRGQYYMVWRSLMEHVKPKDLIGQKRLQVFFNDVQMCQEKNAFNGHDASIVVPEELKLWKQQNELKEQVAEVESRIALTLKTQQELHDKITCKVSQRNLIHEQIKDLQRRTWMLQQVSTDLAAKKDNLQETKSISDSLCSFENTLDIQSKVDRCISLSRQSQQLPIPNPVASSSIVLSEADNNERDEHIMSLVKCRGDALWPHLYEKRAALVEQLSFENTKHSQDVVTRRTTPQTVLSHTAALHASLGVLALRNRLQLTRTRERFATAIDELNNYISGESCELLVLKCEKVRAEARVASLKALLAELGENAGVFGSETGSDHGEASPGKIAAIDKCIVNTRDELKRLISSLSTTERKINNTKDCLLNVFNSFHNNTAIDEERFRGVQIDLPKEPMSVLKQFYTEKSMKTKNDNISLEFEVSDYSYNETIDKNPKFVDELRFYLNKFNLEKNRKLVLDSGDKIWIFETLKSLSSNLYKEWAIHDVMLFCPSVTLSSSIRQLINDIQKINVLESIIKQLHITDATDFSIDISSKINKEEMVLDRIKKCMSENSNLLTKINKTLDISREDLDFWSEANLKKYISSNRTVDGKSYKDYEHFYLENIMLNVRKWSLYTVAQCHKVHSEQSNRPSTSAFITPKDIRLPLKAGPRNTRKRRTLGKSMIATDTPEKDKIEEKKSKVKGLKKVKKSDIFKDKKPKTEQKLEKVVTQDCDTSSDDETFCASGSSSGGEIFLSDSEDEDTLILDDDIISKPLAREPKVGDYVVILIETNKKKKYYYVAKILEESNESGYDYFVSYLKLKSKIFYKFAEPLEPDMAGVLKSDIKFLLPHPKVEGSSRRQATYTFPINFSLLTFPF